MSRCHGTTPWSNTPLVVGVTHCKGRLPQSYKSFVVGVTHCHRRLPQSYKSFVVGVTHCHRRLPRSYKSFVVGVTHCHRRLPRSYKSFVVGVTHCHGMSHFSTVPAAQTGTGNIYLSKLSTTTINNETPCNINFRIGRKHGARFCQFRQVLHQLLLLYR